MKVYICVTKRASIPLAPCIDMIRRNLFCSEELEAGDPAILEDDLLG
jgi:hypothetical protein